VKYFRNCRKSQNLRIKFVDTDQENNDGTFKEIYIADAT
jgi:hypothetical protein